MRARYFLYLSAAGLSVYRQPCENPVAERHFGPDTSGLETFRGWLRELSASARLTLVVDLPDEGFTVELQPFVRGTDRNPLLERRGRQAFPGTPYLTQQSLGRETEGRRDERILFAALTSPETIRPWIDAIETAERILAGVTSPPFLLQPITRHLKQPDTPLFLVHTTAAGTRVTCLQQGVPLFSRLNPTDTPSDRPDSHSLVDDVRRTYHYLVGQRILPRLQILPILLLSTQDETSTYTAGADTQQELQFQHVDLRALAHALNAPPPTDSDSLPLLLALGHPRIRLTQFMHGKARHTQRRHIAHLAGTTLSLLTLGCSGLIAIGNTLETRTLQEQTEHTRTEIQAIERETLALAAATPELPMPLPQLQAGIAQANQLIAQRRSPETLLRELAKVLDSLPDAEIETLEWTNAVDGHASSETQQRLRVRFAQAPAAASAKARAEQATHIINALRRMTATQVEMEQLPSELDPERVLSAPAGDDRSLIIRLTQPPSTR